MGSGDKQSSTESPHWFKHRSNAPRNGADPQGPRLKPMAMMEPEHSSPALLGSFINLAVPGDIALTPSTGHSSSFSTATLSIRPR